MIYEYQTEKGETVDLEFPMGEAPWIIKKHEKGKLRRTIGGAKVQIPEYMKATSDSAIQHYDRKDWRAKKYY